MRTINACINCHGRKVRCDLDGEDTPCSNCRERKLNCIPRTRKTYNSVNRKRSRADREIQDAGPIPPDQANIVASLISQPSARTTSIYIGEGGYSAILDMLTPTPKRRHITVHGAADAALKPEDLEFLQRKGCFVLPDEGHELITAYFRFVHPSFPVLDGASFLKSYADGGLERMNLLLLWCVFSVSSSYVPSCSAIQTRAEFVARGKALFDISGENDKTTLIQAALLLSFWFDDIEDIKQSWYWSGIAFSIAQTLGLDHVPQGSGGNGLWRTIWHCCVLRDAWLSYTMGRPLRLRVKDPPVVPKCGFGEAMLEGHRPYSDEEAGEFERIWKESLRAASVLRQSMSLAPPELQALSRVIEADVQDQHRGSGLPLSVARRNLGLSQNTAIIAVCECTKDSDMAERAAGRVMSMLDSIQSDGSFVYVPPMVVTLLLPYMIHTMAAARSSEKDRKVRADARLAAGLRLFGAIEGTFPAAGIVRQLFSAAWENVKAGRGGMATRTTSCQTKSIEST